MFVNNLLKRYLVSNSNKPLFLTKQKISHIFINTIYPWNIPTILACQSNFGYLKGFVFFSVQRKNEENTSF